MRLMPNSFLLMMNLKVKLLQLHPENIQIIETIISQLFNVIIAGLQDTTLELDSRVTVLEENGGSDGNTSVAELEVRVETLEETVADHETRVTIAETDIEGWIKENK